MAAYNESFRVKVVEFLGRGHTQQEASEIFGVSMKSIILGTRWPNKGKDLNLRKFRVVHIV